MVKIRLTKNKMYFGKKEIQSATVYKEKAGYKITYWLVGSLRHYGTIAKLFSYSGIPLKRYRHLEIHEKKFYHAINKRGQYINYYK